MFARQRPGSDPRLPGYLSSHTRQGFRRPLSDIGCFSKARRHTFPQFTRILALSKLVSSLNTLRRRWTVNLYWRSSFNPNDGFFFDCTEQGTRVRQFIVTVFERFSDQENCEKADRGKHPSHHSSTFRGISDIQNAQPPRTSLGP